MNRYTSLGSTNNTHPNPFLLRARTADGDAPAYDPAYMLTDESKERAGRDDVPAQRTRIGMDGRTNGAVVEGKEP